MAYVNVAEWSPDQIADWIKGVDETVAVYAPVFLSHRVCGHNLLKYRADDLDNLNITSIGHQELILDAVAQLRNFHYELDRENLQCLSLRLSCAATSLYKELLHHEDSSKVETQILSDVAYVIGAVKPLVLWLDRSPFLGLSEYANKKIELLRLSLKMATAAQRGRFAVNPLQSIRDSCEKLADIANIIIQEIPDPMVLQPATLDLITLKKRENELGFEILPSVSGIYQIVNIKSGSPAQSSGKIEIGDEIVQVNYQTVVGWQLNEIIMLCQESPIDVLLTLKKRPRHTHTYGQIYMKPYRLPSKKRTPYNKWGSLPSPRPELLIKCNFEMPPPKPSPVPIPPPCLDTEGNSSSDDNEMLSPPASPTTLNQSQLRIYMPKPRSVVQRRNSISGGSPISKRANTSIEQFWRKLKNQKSLQHSGSAQISDFNDPDDMSDNLYRREKSLSCNTGLELSPRPKTCLGVGITHPKVVKLNARLLADGSADCKNSKTVKFQDQLVVDSYTFSNDSDTNSEKDAREPTRERGRLDKSYSTPAYDFGENENGEFPLMKEIIPESPTSSVDSPTIIVHSPQKVEQILEFKKTSEQLSDVLFQQARDKNKLLDSVSNITKHTRDSSNDSTASKLNFNNEIIETINVPMIESKKISNDFGETKLPKNKIFFETHDVIETMNDGLKIFPNNTISPKMEVPPEPPPRPLSTQKPGYVPNKHKNIQKEDIQVIPNLNINHPALYLKDNRIDIVSSAALSTDIKHSGTNLSSIDLSSPRSPLPNSMSLQRLEPDFKSQNSQSHSNISKLDTSIVNVKFSPLDTPKLSLSPPNAGVRGILSSGKSKNLKKKNSILAKRRKVSVKDLGCSDMEGYLYQRCRTKNNSNANWQLRWYILIDNTFYGFKSKESTKAECLIFLSGFTVSVAQEVKSKQFAFKVYHTGTAFYFACESGESMAIWVENITRATLTNNDSWERASKKDKKTDESKHFSETDYSDDDFTSDSLTSQNSPIEKTKTMEKQEKSEKSYKFGSLKKIASRLNKSDSHENVNHSSTSLDRKYLRFFSTKHKKDKLKSNDVPVPTEQYRSYRKIPTTTITPPPCDDTIKPKSLPESKDDNVDKFPQNVAKIKKIESIECSTSKDKELLSELTKQQSKRSNPMNYIHASNPNLLDFDTNFFASKSKNSTPFSKGLSSRPDNLVGFVTLEQFMLNKQEEDRRQKYSNRVLMGIERDFKEEKNQNMKEENILKQLDKIIPDVIYGEIPTFMDNKPNKIEQIQKRCLPKTPDDRMSGGGDSFSQDAKSPHRKSLKGDKRSFRSKKKNDGYETINYDEMTDASKNDQSPFKTMANVKKSDETPSKSEVNHSRQSSLTNTIESKWTPKTSTDLGYEMIYGDESETSEFQKSPMESSSSSVASGASKSRKYSHDGKKPTPPPKTSKIKNAMNRQNSVSSIGERKTGIDDRPVFKQGDSPEKFWLDSLRRNDRVHSKTDKFFTKHTEPSAFMKSSEATIVKSDKLQNKSHAEFDSIKSTEHKPLKNAAQYTPMSLSLSPNKALKTSPNFEIFLDTKDPAPPVSSISRLRQIFQPGHSSSKTNATLAPPQTTQKEKTLLGSPRLHRAIFRKNHHHNSSAVADEWTKDFSYSKLPSSSAKLDHLPQSDSYLYTLSTQNESVEPIINFATTPDYSHLEYPPIFEPETYSVANPGPSILKKLYPESNEKK